MTKKSRMCGTFLFPPSPTIKSLFTCLSKYHITYLKQPIILALQFYRLLLLYNIAFTTLGIFLSLFTVGHLNAAIILWGKLIGFGGALGLYHFSANQSYFYFRNAGYPISAIIWIAFAFDNLCYILLALILIWSHVF